MIDVIQTLLKKTVDRILEDRKTLTKQEMLGVKKYYLAKIFTVRYSWWMALDNHVCENYCDCRHYCKSYKL